MRPQPSSLTRPTFIDRATVRAQPDTLFVFGDNMQRRGLGGQAREMRGEPNSVGVPTKWAPHTGASAFFQDRDWDRYRVRAINSAFEKLENAIRSGRTVAVPADGLGTGRAELATRAPRIAIAERMQALGTMAGSPEPKETRMADLTPATSNHPWTEVVKKLQEAAPFLDQHDPDLRRRIEKLTAEIQDQPESLQDQWIRTRAAYIVADIDRHTGGAMTLSPAIREEVDRLAVSSPGLRHEALIALLRQTADLDVTDKSLVQEIRKQARSYVTGAGAPGADFESRIEQLEARVRTRIAGPEPPPIAGVPESVSSQTQAQQSAQAKQSSEPAQEPGDQAPSSSSTLRQSAPAGQAPAAQPAQPRSDQTATASSSRFTAPMISPYGLAARLGSLVRAMASPQQESEAPWSSPNSSLADRVQNFQAAKLDQRSQTLMANTDAAARAAIKAFSALEDGPGRDVLHKIERAASNDPNGFRGVIASMHPGGRNEQLRDEYNALLAQNPAFGTALSRAGAGLENYAAARAAAVEDYQKRGWDLSTLEARLRACDQTIAEAAERIPGRKSGKSIYEELSERAAEAIRNLIEKVRHLLGGGDPHAKPAQTVTPKQTMAM